MPSRDRDSITQFWLVVFVLLSLLAHAVAILAIVLVSIFVPKPKFNLPPPDNPSVTLSLLPTPPPARPLPKPIFMPTAPDPTAKHEKQIVESDNDTVLKSHTDKSRQPDSIMPDVVSKKEHTSDLTDSPSVPTQPKPQGTPAPPTPKQETARQPPTPPQPKPDKQVEQTPPQPTPNPSKKPAPQVTKNTVDPDTGLPVLPPLDAPTMAPPTSTQATQAAAPSPSLPTVASNVAGRAGISGDPTPAAMATELGRYKAKVYRAVGSRWYQKVGQQLQVLPVGTVHIQFTIHSDGSVETKVLDDTGNNGSTMLLRSISLNSIIEAAPFDKFSDSMLKEVGDSYTDDFSFSIYGGG